MQALHRHYGHFRRHVRGPDKSLLRKVIRGSNRRLGNRDAIPNKLPVRRALRTIWICRCGHEVHGHEVHMDPSRRVVRR